MLSFLPVRIPRSRRGGSDESRQKIADNPIILITVGSDSDTVWQISDGHDHWPGLCTAGAIVSDCQCRLQSAAYDELRMLLHLMRGA